MTLLYFFAEKWRLAEEDKSKINHRAWVKEQFWNRMADFTWNAHEVVGIIPTIHGTSASVAWKICQGGFANLSALDVGYFGSGIYFATSAKYALPYYATKQNPAIIISYLIPGNPYPVTESPNGPNSIAGTTLKPGYQSHYVSVNARGFPHEAPTNYDLFDEIVINQEAQVAPAYLLYLDRHSFSKLIKEYERKTIQTENAEARNTFHVAEESVSVVGFDESEKSLLLDEGI